MSKSHVGRSVCQCPVCGKTHSESVLLHKNLKEVFDTSKPVHGGWEMCEEHKQQIDAGYCLLVAIDTEKSDMTPRDGMSGYSPDNVVRTGSVAAVRRHVAEMMFSGYPEDGFPPMAYVPEEVIEHLHSLETEANDNPESDTPTVH